MAADADVYGGDLMPEAWAVGWDEVLGGVFEQLGLTGFEQPAADALRAVVVEGGVGGKMVCSGLAVRMSWLVDTT